MAGTSNTQRTLKALRDQGYTAGMAERFNQFVGPINPRTGRPVGIRQDLFGFIDIIAITPVGICAVQSCGQAFAEHDRKILANEIAPLWLKAGGFILLYGWRKILKKRGQKLKVWSPRIKEYTVQDFNEEEPKCQKQS